MGGPPYDHLYVPLISKQDKLQPQTNIFLGNKNPFLIKITVARVKTPETKEIFFQCEISLPGASKQKGIYFTGTVGTKQF